MIDIETLGTGMNACILSIGAVIFDPFAEAGFLDPEGIEGFYALVIPQPDRSIDADTVMWWLRQAEAARKAVSESKGRVSLGSALGELEEYADGCNEWWSHGLSFDLMILSDVYRQIKIPSPWTYRQLRDTRTLFSLVADADMKKIRPANRARHHPTWDAAAQALLVQRVIAHLGRSRS